MTPFNPVEALTKLISIRSFSKEEEPARDFMESVLTEYEIDFTIDLNNIWAKNKHFDSSKYTILLNSHLDTVKPNKGYTKDPYYPQIEEGKLYGLGSNDAGERWSLYWVHLYTFMKKKGCLLILCLQLRRKKKLAVKMEWNFYSRGCQKSISRLLVNLHY